MKDHKIFKPDLMLKDTIRSCWSQNIKTIKDKIPVNQFLKNKGVYALDIFPISTEYVYSFAIPVNKNWEPETFKETVNLTFSVYTENPISFDVIFQDDKQKNTEPTKIEIGPGNIDIWKEFTIQLSIKENVRLIIFSGSAENTPNYVIKDIVIKA